jgi:hypothetical protein
MESTATDDGLEEFWGIVGAKKSNADHRSTSIVRTTLDLLLIEPPVG